MSKDKKPRFAVFFGNRAFFPASLQAGARREMRDTLKKLGYEALMMDARTTRYGAVETVEEGQKYANFLQQNRGKFDGVILCLPNFGDETGAVAALKEARVPILIQAYPDQLDKMAPDQRRDAFCGKFSIMDVFCQYGVPFTALKPHTAHPRSREFGANLDYFDRVCRVVGAMRDMVVGAIGARTTPFKTVRIDELALQKHGVTVETFDLADVFARMKALKASEAKVRAKANRLRAYAVWTGVPRRAFDNIVRLAVVLDDIIDECGLDAVAVRCWLEMQKEFGISPCVVLSELNDRGVPAACEVDIGSAVTMCGLGKASGQTAVCLDWNNNYGDDGNKCILFHCGPVPASMMAGKGRVTDHGILIGSLGKGCAYGCNVGRITPGNMTFGNMLTDAGKLKFYLGRGEITSDPIADDFFGCAGVAEIENLQDVLQKIGYMGHRHHVTVAPGDVVEPLAEAFEKYLGYEVTLLHGNS